MSSDLYPESLESVAIIGMSGRFPGARNIEEFWENLRNGVESIQVFDRNELLAAGVDAAIADDPNFVPAGGALDGLELFDAEFFGYNARDAEIMDPQQRLFLECSWEALEDAGYDPLNCPGSVGVFAGSAMSTYLFHLYAHADRLAFVDNFQLMLGNDKDHLTTNVSYKLNLKGPSVAVQTACSTSLVAVCMACQSVLSYQCDMALAGGVGISVPQRKGYLYQPGGIGSPDGHCRAFEAQARGTVGGNGLGVVTLKRLSEALHDGDPIRAVIVGSAVNNDGSTKVGYTAPSVDGQAEVIALSHALAGIDAGTISYVECHGTATPMGDPIELAALTQAFRVSTQKKHFCGVGSVKTNLGHLDPAAGVAGLIKTVLSMENGALPPTLHFENPNPDIDFANSPFYVNSSFQPWISEGRPRRAGVSSFGIGGTNAHLVLEEAPEPELTSASREPQMLLLSARTPSALQTRADQLGEYLDASPESALADIGYTLKVGRTPFQYRSAVVCRDRVEAVAVLTGRERHKMLSGVVPAEKAPVIFMFPGQGSQYVGMGRELFNTEPEFNEQVSNCAELLMPLLGFNLCDLMCPSKDGKAAAAEHLKSTRITQPALFVIEYALARQLMAWGIRPDAMIGHSIGEYVAACISGVLCLNDALELVANRGEMMSSLPPGLMLAVTLSESETRELIDENISIAAVNGPEMCVVSGSQPHIERIEATVVSMGLMARRLQTSHAFHSCMMDPVLPEFTRLVRGTTLNLPQIPYLSNVTGDWIGADSVQDPEYWSTQLRQTVRFAAGMEKILSEPRAVFLEVGPGQSLSTLARMQPGRTAEQLILNSMGTATDNVTDMTNLLQTLARLWVNGADVDWPSFYANERRLRVPLPKYPFGRQHYWVGPSERDSVEAFADEPVGRAIDDWFYAPVWKRDNEAIARNPDSTPEHCLIFDDGGELGEALCQILEPACKSVSRVLCGACFEQRGINQFTLSTGRRSDYAKLFDALEVKGCMPDAIVHLWTVPRNEEDELELIKAQEPGLMSLLALASETGSRILDSEVEISVVTSGLFAPIGNEKLSPEKAPLLGACKVIPQEYLNIRCRIIDLAADELEPVRQADAVTLELTAYDYKPVVAYRGGHRWIQSFERLPMREAASAQSEWLKESGTYLISGGLGRIGLYLAEQLATSLQAKIVLTRRSSFPERHEWQHWLAQSNDGEISDMIRLLLKFEELGAKVLTFTADMAEPDQMRHVLRETRRHFGRIDGVFHAAGATGADSVHKVAETSAEVCVGQLRPKAQGLMVLERLLRDEPPAFYLLLSSLSAVLGGLGFAAYAGANVFLDTFAAMKNQARTSQSDAVWISINWDGWNFTDNPSANAVYPAEGVDALFRIMGSSHRQVLVSTTDLDTRIEQWVTRIAEQHTQAETVSLHPRPDLNIEYTAPDTDATQKMVDILQELLGVGPIGIHDNFFDLGGHSLLAIQLVSRLQRSFQTEVPVQWLFESPTIALLSERIDRALAADDDEEGMLKVLEMVEQMSEEEVRSLLEQDSGEKENV